MDNWLIYYLLVFGQIAAKLVENGEELKPTAESP